MEPGPAQQFVDLTLEVRAVRTGKGANHQVGAGRQGRQTGCQQVAQLPDHAMPVHGVADEFADNKTRPGHQRVRTGHEVQDEMWGGDAPTATHHEPEIG